MVRPDNMNSRNRNAAMEEINVISFAIDELRLYLDTHPNCTEALVMIREYMNKRHDMMKAFTEKYGSIEAYAINDGDKWLWNAGYMPWENGEGGFC